MAVFSFDDSDVLGRVFSVDTTTVVIDVEDDQALTSMQVNRLVALESIAGQHLVGMIQKITRKELVLDAVEDIEASPIQNLVKVALIGTLFDKRKQQENVFTRSIEAVPRIHAACYAIENEALTRFMRVLSNTDVDENSSPLKIGVYTLDDVAEAYLDGDRFFQRHAVVVGSTGSGKSWTTAQLLEQVAGLSNGNALVFDIHGEYGSLKERGFRHLKVAGPGDLGDGKGIEDGLIYLPYWLLSYEAIVPMFVDRSDSNAPNQTVMMTELIRQSKESFLKDNGDEEVLANFTLDSPVPFDVEKVLKALKEKDVEMVAGSGGKTKQGPYFGKLTRLVARFESKINDRRLGFLFRGDNSSDYLNKLAVALTASAGEQEVDGGGVKVIDFSEVPSDILPLVISLVARMVFALQQWTLSENRQPIALFCDEAHNYIPDRSLADAAAEISIDIFEKIAKEGRKYGVGLVVISQRPSEVNRTVLSQCNNFVAMRLTNTEDQNRIKALLPENLGGYADILPALDTGEALVVGDASLLPARVKVHEPRLKPNSATVPFWEKWSSDDKREDLAQAVRNWQRQSTKKLDN